VWQEKIEINGPYNFDEALRRQSIDPLNVISLDQRLVKVPMYVGDQPAVVTVQATGTTENPGFIISGQKPGQKYKAIEKIAEVFQFDFPLQDVFQHFQQTQLQGLFSEHYGTPFVLEFDPYGCIQKCIIHQQLNMAFAHTLSTRFVKEFGFEVEGVWFYPRPEVVAELKVEQLRELQFSGRKAEYVIGVGKEVAEGRLDFEKIKQMSDEEVLQHLTKLRGVGPWTVQNFLMFGLGRPNLFPAADIGIQNALKKLYRMDRKPTKEEMDNFKQGWEPYLSYASLYLWRSIE
jgi:DNA-3-methyladenine glycosylase II